jgi:hypothetical protein
MGYYIGQFYFDKRDLFLLSALLALGIIIHFDFPLPLFNPKNLLVLTLLIFISKGTILPAHDAVVYVTFLSAMFLTLFFPLFKVLLFLVFAFLFLRLTKAI